MTDKKEGGMVGSVIIAIVIVSIWILGNREDTESLSGPDSVGALTAAQEFVTKNLKCPSTAKFPWASSDDVVTYDDGEYTVCSYVDAQNLMGATVRKDYLVIVTNNGYSWQLKYLQIGKQALTGLNR